MGKIHLKCIKITTQIQLKGEKQQALCMIENDLIFFETKIKIKINFYKFTGGDLDHLKDQVQLKDLDLFHQDQLILNNPARHAGAQTGWSKKQAL